VFKDLYYYRASPIVQQMNSCIGHCNIVIDILIALAPPWPRRLDAQSLGLVIMLVKPLWP